MGLFNIFRRKKKSTAPASTLKEIWRGFQQVLALNNAVLTLMEDLEAQLSAPGDLDLSQWCAQVDVLDRHFANLVSALQSMSGNRWGELEPARMRIREAIRQRLGRRAPLVTALLVRLEEAGPEVLPALGGKAANLARVKNQLGLPVPDGVVATLTAYRVFMAQEAPDGGGSLLARIKARLAAVDLAEPPAVEMASRDIQPMILAQPLPEALQQDLLMESRRLAEASGARLAVRSSGGREDLGLTFAGQYESFLGVAPEEVPSCWRQVVASQFGERAMIYFKLQGLSLEDAAMGVLIQRLVDARAAGVMFIADHEGDDPDRLVVNATWGLAADLVSGRVSADEFIISRENGRLLRAGMVPKEEYLAVREGRLTRLPVAQDKVAAPALEEGDLAQLAALARSLEGYDAGPQVVEWAQDQAGRLFIIQSRHLLSLKAGTVGPSQAVESPAG
ncbi:MAG TPA: PEP/pyruvate-binding domain-containing protein, partial [Desulfobaccales bacterium]